MGFSRLRPTGALLLSGLFCHAAGAAEHRSKAVPPPAVRTMTVGTDVPYARGKALMLAEHWTPALLGQSGQVTVTVWRRGEADAALTLALAATKPGTEAKIELASRGQVVMDVVAPGRQMVPASYAEKSETTGVVGKPSLLCGQGLFPNIQQPEQQAIFEYLTAEGEDVTIRANPDDDKNWYMAVVGPDKRGCVVNGHDLYVNENWAAQRQSPLVAGATPNPREIIVPR